MARSPRRCAVERGLEVRGISAMRETAPPPKQPRRARNPRRLGPPPWVARTLRGCARRVRSRNVRHRSHVRDSAALGPAQFGAAVAKNGGAVG